MLRSLRELEGFRVEAVDGKVGTVVDSLFDDERWVLRYLVVKAGGLVLGHRVLLTPLTFRDVDWEAETVHLRIDKDTVERSPGVESDRPVSRRLERAHHLYYGYPFYWAYGGLGGVPIAPVRTAEEAQIAEAAAEAEDEADTHLRSAAEVRGYGVQGTDDSIGHVDDFLLDEDSWEVRYLVVDTSNWWFGKDVLIPPEWATLVSWDERHVKVQLTRQQVETAPEWHGVRRMNRDFEQRLYDHYGRLPHWADPHQPAGPDSEAPRSGSAAERRGGTAEGRDTAARTPQRAGATR